MSPKELKALVKAMRANGVLRLKDGQTEIELSPESLFPKASAPIAAAPPTPEPDTSSLKDIKMPQQLSALQLALWSSIGPEEEQDALTELLEQ